MSKKILRRDVLKSAGATGIGFWLAGGAQAAPSKSPNERLGLAIVGVGSRGGSTHVGIGGKGRATDRQIVGLCDCDRRKAGAKAEQIPGAKAYSDFRKMLDELGKSIDAVTVATHPDNNHANPALWAMARGKHVYLEKPMATTVGECRWLARAARENKVITQLGNQHHSEYGFRRAAQLVKAGVIGKVTEVHCNIESRASQQKVWLEADELAKLPARQARVPQGTEPVPDWLDWDAWLGPAKFRPYHPGWMFGGWREYSIHNIGNFHNHWVDAAYMALDLKYPTTVESIGAKTDPLLDPVVSVRYTFAARGDQPAVAVYWHGAGTGPTAEMLEGLVTPTTGKRPPVLFIGERGRLAASFGNEPQLLPAERFKGVELPAPEKIHAGHSELWIQGIRNNTRCECDFHDYAQYLGEGAPLGLIAFWAGGKIEWDGPNMKAPNCPEADAWLTREFRKEWKP